MRDRGVERECRVRGQFGRGWRVAVSMKIGGLGGGEVGESRKEIQ